MNLFLLQEARLAASRPFTTTGFAASCAASEEPRREYRKWLANPMIPRTNLTRTRRTTYRTRLCNALAQSAADRQYALCARQILPCTTPHVDPQAIRYILPPGQMLAIGASAGWVGSDGTLRDGPVAANDHNSILKPILRRQQMKKYLVVFGLAAVLAIPALAGTTTWQLDPMHTNAQFTVRHLGISNVQGEFTKISGTVTLDDQDITKSSVSATIDVTSIDTRVGRRDDDLKSEHFFNVAQFPTLTFQSTKIVKTGDNSLKVTGNLTIRGVTKEVTLDVTGPTAPVKAMGGLRRGAAATTHINRQDFGVAADPGMVGDDITIQIDLEMTAPAPAQ
jgi:polyisoprenoid-binding protein YceI